MAITCPDTRHTISCLAEKIMRKITGLILTLVLIVLSVAVIFGEEPSTDTSSGDPMASESNINEPTLSEPSPSEPTPSEPIHVTDIIVGQPLRTLNVGESAALEAVIEPSDAQTQIINYSSSAPDVLTVNEAGTITAMSAGTATITLSADGIKRMIEFVVVAPSTVTSIDVTSFNDRMKVTETQSISATVYPTNAENAQITYSTSDVSVATVSEGGTVTAVGAGEAKITLLAGNVSKTLNLTVYVATEKIEVSENYIILQPNENRTIKVSVFPSDASQSVTFKSTNVGVATVNSYGTISAVGVGLASILIDNGDSMKAVTVVVNKGASTYSEVANGDSEETTAPEAVDELITLIENAGTVDTISISGVQWPTIPSSALKLLYGTEKVLVITYPQYSLVVDGRSIKNAENTLSTRVTFTEDAQGLHFTINDKKQLPGSIQIELTELDSSYQYLYLYNDTTGKFERLSALDGTSVTISIAGEYLLTSEKIKENSITTYALIGFGIIIVVSAGVYIGVKKQYWFW